MTKKKPQKVWSGHGPRENNGMANKYVQNTKEGAKRSNHAHIPKHTQDRKVKKDGDKVKEKHGMKPHPPPYPHNMHTLSL